MSFASPVMLLALALIPVGLWLYRRHERAASRRRDAFASPAVLPSVAPRRAGRRRHVVPAVYALALAALAVALARPQATVAVPVEQATVMLVTDHSGSMQATDVAPSRLAAAQRAAERFLDQVPDGVRVGAVAFNHRARLLESPTTDHAAVRAALASLEPSGATATGDALSLALRASAGEGGRRPPTAVVLLSDGASVRGADPVAVAAEAAAAKVPVYTVALGTDAGTIESRRADGSVRAEPVPPDRATLQAMAERSGGRFFAAADAASLDEAYDRLGSQVATRPELREVTAAAAGGALLLVLAGAGLSLTWFGRLP